MGIILKYFAFNFGTYLSLPLLELKPSVLDPQCEDTIDDDMRDRETKRTDSIGVAEEASHRSKHTIKNVLSAAAFGGGNGGARVASPNVACRRASSSFCFCNCRLREEKCQFISHFSPRPTSKHCGRVERRTPFVIFCHT